ncbi:fimbrial biogenesis outer membrane usher protein [Acinetobacter guillouiae]|uniref:fimbria/pilus outer membrane usher protein n=1 Tax=Acinetobacter guillouiae TaxID=106649 RepID=UPI0021CFA942|nr:fimbria/pilus outer membrane usher protein [Acinetobacter guillouiae]MCU4492255.1 fimbrial biogenesis outer membrane usher protein [Acinetobacter guillouiae]
MLNFKKSELCLMLLSAIAVQVSAEENQPDLIAQDNSHLIAQNNNQLVAQNNQIVTFNAASLFGNDRNVSLTNFEVKNFIAPGKYLVQLSVNQQTMDNIEVKFDHLDGQRSAVLCIDNALLEKIDLTAEFRKSLSNKPCRTIKELNEDAYYDFDLSKLKLDISIPQALLVARPEGYIDPKLFSQGVNSAFLGYAFNYNKDEDRESKYLGLNGGLNVAGWYYRHSGAFESENSGLGHYYSDQNVLYRDITRLSSRLSLGQFNTTTYRLDNLPIVGAQLASDQEMLPWSARQYAPVIQNFANTNALVRIYQSGQKIYERTVPAGAFVIRDLNAASSGDLTVEIIETGGEKRTFNVAMQSNYDLVRQGRYNYSIAGGRYRTRHETTDDKLFQGSFNYGLNNALTIGAGTNVSDDYTSGLVSLSVNTLLGGLTAFVEHTESELYRKDYDGQKYSFNYRYDWLPKNLNFYADYAAYDRGYMSISSHLYQRNIGGLTDQEYDDFLYNYNLKQNVGVSLSKSFPNTRLGNLNLTVRKNNYWDDSQDYYQYNFSYGNSWNRISYNIGLSRTDYSDRSRDRGDTAYFSMTIPLDWRNKNLSMNASVQHDQNSQTTSNVNVSGVLGAHNELNFGAGIINNQHDTMFNGNVNYLLPTVNLGATLSTNESNTQYSLSAQGAVVAHRFGITPVNTLPDTYTIVHAEEGAGAVVSNAWGVKVDSFGNAIYPYNAPYSKNLISLDPADLPVNVTLESNQTEVIPRKYSSQLAEFKANTSSNILLRIRETREYQVPMGSLLKDSQGNVLGVVGASSQVIVDKQDALMQTSHVVWGAENNQQCSIAAIAKTQLERKHAENFNIIDVECK